MQRTITRAWGSRTVSVSTVHPEHGTMYRGRICMAARPVQDPQARMSWTVIDQDGAAIDQVVGDYLTAETRLLDATAWADEPFDPDEQI